MLESTIGDAPAIVGHAPGKVIFALCLATAAEGIFLGGVLPILPAIGHVYGLTASALFWVSAVFLVAVGVSCPILSRLGDLHGHRKLVLLTLTITILGVVLDMVAPNYPLFLLGRICLGFCPAITPLAVGVFRHTLPERSTRFGIGAIAAAMTAGTAVGMISAGYVFNATQSIGWVFASWLILLVPSVICVARLVPESPVLAVKDRMDWPGAAALALGVAALLFGLAYGPKVGWDRPIVIGAFIVCLAAIVGWWVIESRTARPLVDLRMLTARAARPFYISSFLWGAAVYGSQTTVVLFMATSSHARGYGFSLSILALAWLLLPQNIMNMLGSLAVTRVVNMFGGYRTAGMIGSLLMAIGFVGVILASDSLWPFILFAAIGGFGSGFMQPTLSGMVSEVCGKTQRGISAGMFQTLKNIGGSVASASGAAVFAAMVIGTTSVPSKTATIIIFSGCLFVSLCMSVVIGFSRGVRQDRPIQVPLAAAMER